LKYECIASENTFYPILKNSYLKVAAPFEYVIPSKIVAQAIVSLTSPAIGWVVLY